MRSRIPKAQCREVSMVKPCSDEHAPAIIDAAEPSRVLWGSIWGDRQDLRLAFEIDPDHEDDRYGCTVT